MTIRGQVPRLIGQAFLKGRLSLAAMALDLCVPPLSFLVLLWLAVTGVVAVAWLLGARTGAGVVVGCGWVLLVGALFLAWAKFARDILPGRTLLAIPLYVMRKVPLYAAFWRRRQGAWVRTRRDSSAADTIGAGSTSERR
jgi:hypothetical protein